jgi:O-methyltransferase involved in polyketide biosynthesis
MAILFQSRYHAINAAVANADHDNNQVIEFAAGISPRGFQWSQTSPGTIYVESDLPQLMIHKSKLIRNALIRRDAPGRGILHCCAADVLDRNSMLDAIKNFDCQQPITFVTEGLLLYFNPLEMQQFWDNMKLLLTEHPNSVWITDLVTKKNLVDSLDAHVGVAQAVRSVFQLTSRNVVADNPFEDDSSVEKHLKGFGLSLKSSLQMREALSLLPIDDPETLALAVQLVGNRRIWRISA